MAYMQPTPSSVGLMTYLTGAPALTVKVFGTISELTVKLLVMTCPDALATLLTAGELVTLPILGITGLPPPPQPPAEAGALGPDCSVLAKLPVAAAPLPFLSTTLKTPVYIPMEQEKGIRPISLGVNSIIFSPWLKYFLMLYLGMTILEAQENWDWESITHLTGTPCLMVKLLGE